MKDKIHIASIVIVWLAINLAFSFSAYAATTGDWSADYPPKATLVGNEIYHLQNDPGGAGSDVHVTTDIIAAYLGITAGSNGYIDIDEHASAPGTPASGSVRFYAKADGNLYQKDDTGAETLLAGGGGGGLTNWSEAGTTLQPNADDYNLGSATNLIGEIWGNDDLTIRYTDDSGDAFKLNVSTAAVTMELFKDAEGTAAIRFPTKNYVYNNNLHPTIFGSTAPPGGANDPYIVLAGTVDDTVGAANSYQSGTGVNSHGIMDLRILARTGNIGINSFDARLDVNGTAPYDHIAGFQFFPNIGTTGIVDRLTGYQSLPDYPANGTINWMRHYEARDIDLLGGSGTVTNQAGLFLESMTAATNNYWILGGGDFDGGGADVDHNVLTVRTTDAQGSWPTMQWDDSSNAWRFLNSEIAFADEAGIRDANGNEVLTFDTATSSVNYVRIGGNATGTGARVQARGDDANVDLILSGQGTGGVMVNGDLDITGDMSMTNLEVDRIDYNEQASITNPAAGDGTIYLDSDDNTFKAIVADEGNTLQTILTDQSQGVQFQSYQVSDLSDATTPSVLVTAETDNKLISNYKASGADHVFTMPAAHAGGNVTFVIGDEFQVDIEPNSGDLFYLNGTAMAVDEHIQNTADTLGDTIVGVCVNINGTYRWMFRASDSNWVEATP